MPSPEESAGSNKKPVGIREKTKTAIIDEVVMFRYKRIFGVELDARTVENQKTEVKLKCLT